MKYIDANKLGPFNGGAALVWKGLSTAMIDAKGNFIVPYNKYNFYENYGSIRSRGNDSRSVSDGLFNFYTLDSKSGGVMNSKGKILSSQGHFHYYQ